MKINFKNSKGFTLVETLVYIAIFSLFIGSLISFLNTITTSRLNNQIVLEVNNQGNQIIRNITSSIENASSINSPSISGTSQTLSISTPSIGTSPIVFFLNSGTLFMTEGAGSPIPLTNNKVIVSSLVFSNLGLASNSGSIQIRFTITSNITNSSHLTKTADFYGSASIRR